MDQKLGLLNSRYLHFKSVPKNNKGNLSSRKRRRNLKNEEQLGDRYNKDTKEEEIHCYLFSPEDWPTRAYEE